MIRTHGSGVGENAIVTVVDHLKSNLRRITIWVLATLKMPAGIWVYMIMIMVMISPCRLHHGMPNDEENQNHNQRNEGPLQGEALPHLPPEMNNNEVVKMVCGAFYIPKDNPDKPKGEDAYFICEEGQTIGVADGVGSWAKKGIDAGEYARQLMNNAKEKTTMDHVIGGPAAVVDPTKVLNQAYANNVGVDGSSTACILTLDKGSGVLHGVNVGDSGFMVFRDSKLQYKSETQQKRFNCPYQLGNERDSPESAEVIEVETVPGDIIVLGTDGLLDNIYPSEIEDILAVYSPKFKDKQLGGGVYCRFLANTLAFYAHKNSINGDYKSPFSRAAEEAGFKWVGGKIDDITVIVASVVAAS